MTPVDMAHHATAKVHLPSTIEKAKYVYVRTDAVRAPLVRPYTGPFRVLEKSAKYFKIWKNGRPDNISIDRLKPAFIYEDDNIDTAKKPRQANEEITQPRLCTKNPEPSVSAETTEVAAKSYRDVLLGDQPSSGKDRPKRAYVRRLAEQRTEASATKSGRVSRPPVRF